MIEPALGDGLGATREFVERLAQLFPGLSDQLGEDAVTFNAGSDAFAITSDSFAVEPIFFPGGDLGTLAVCGVVNDLACRGAAPEALLLNVLAGPAATAAELDRVMESVAASCANAGMRLVGGDTKYLTGTEVGIVLSAFGVGRVGPWPHELTLRSAEPGDRIICTGTLANHAVAVLSQREGLGFERVVHSDCQPLWPVVEALQEVAPDGVAGLRDLTRGGLGAALLDLARMSDHAVTVDAGEVPVDTLVRAACEMLALDPMFLVNEGRLMVVAREHETHRILEALRMLEPSRGAAVIGEVTARARGSDLVTVVTDGVRSPLNEPAGLAAPRLC